MRTSKHYEPGEKEKIFQMKEEGVALEDIAKEAGRSVAAIQSLLYKKDRRPEGMKDQKPMPTPREMIKALYERGYRIRNNELYVIREEKVNLYDIIKK